MSTYHVDVGSWERGRVVTIIAASDGQAIKEAFGIKRDNDEDIVQIKRVCGDGKKRYIYDMWNGDTIY